MFTFDARAMDAMIQRVRTMGTRARTAAHGTASAAAADVLAAARDRAPVETGELRDSGQVVVVGTPDGAVASVAFTAPHALAVHEDLSARHDDGQAKFLESAVLDVAPETFHAHGADALKRALEG